MPTVAEVVASTRREQGLPERVEDTAILDAAARLVACASRTTTARKVAA